jgi:nucleoside-diphosphate-sugar epimerase
MWDSSRKPRVLLLGGASELVSRVGSALAAAGWAEPVVHAGRVTALDATTLADIDAVFSATMGAPHAIRDAANALGRALRGIHPAFRVVHLSSMTVYGSFEGLAAESTPLRTDFGAYGAAHVEAEARLALHPGTVILRPGCEYGPGCVQWTERIARLLRARRLGDLGALGDGVCNLLFIDDLVSAVLESLQRSGVDGRRFNLGMRAPPTWNEYLIRFGRALGAVPVTRLGSRRLRAETRLLAPPLKILDLLESRWRRGPARMPPAVTPSLLHACGQDLTLDTRAAEDGLGLTWTPLAEGLARAAAACGAPLPAGRRVAG